MSNWVFGGGTRGKILTGSSGPSVGKQYGLYNPKTPAPVVPDIPAAPTIDTAQQNREQQDRIRRRRGVLANIYGGATGSGASGKATLG